MTKKNKVFFDDEESVTPGRPKKHETGLIEPVSSDSMEPWLKPTEKNTSDLEVIKS